MVSKSAFFTFRLAAPSRGCALLNNLLFHGWTKGRRHTHPLPQKLPPTAAYSSPPILFHPPPSNVLAPVLSSPLQGDDRIDPTEWRFLISGMSPGQSQMENPDPSWIEVNVWGEIKALCGIPYFEEFAAVFSQRTVAWRRFVAACVVCLAHHGMKGSDAWAAVLLFLCFGRTRPWCSRTRCAPTRFSLHLSLT